LTPLNYCQLDAKMHKSAHPEDHKVRRSSVILAYGILLAFLLVVVLQKKHNIPDLRPVTPPIPNPFSDVFYKFPRHSVVFEAFASNLRA